MNIGLGRTPYFYALSKIPFPLHKSNLSATAFGEGTQPSEKSSHSPEKLVPELVEYLLDRKPSLLGMGTSAGPLVAGQVGKKTVSNSQSQVYTLIQQSLVDRESLENFLRRLAYFGWVSRTEFEELWVLLLSVLNPQQEALEDRAESSAASHSTEYTAYTANTASTGHREHSTPQDQRDEHGAAHSPRVPRAPLADRPDSAPRAVSTAADADGDSEAADGADGADALENQREQTEMVCLALGGIVQVLMLSRGQPFGGHPLCSLGDSQKGRNYIEDIMRPQWEEKSSTDRFYFKDLYSIYFLSFRVETLNF